MFRANSKTLIFLSLICIATVLLGQSPRTANVQGKDFRTPYFEGNTLKAEFSGQEANPIPNSSRIELKQFQIKTFRDGNSALIDQLIFAPECVFDKATRRAESSGPLRMHTAATNYFIEGNGFVWEEMRTNVQLVISNNVHTIIERGATTLTNTAPKSASTNPPIQIYADRFRFTSETNSENRVARYFGHVRVEDYQIELLSDTLVVTLPPPGKSARDIVAEGHVVILSKQDQSRATGDKATYRMDERGEFVEITGSPGTQPSWRDPRYQGEADKFIFDRRSKIVRGEGNGHLVQLNTNKTAQASSPSQAFEIFGETLVITLPETNGPIRGLTADQRVRIINTADKIRTSSDSAKYSEGQGILELFGNPTLQMNETEVRGDTIVIGISNRVITAQPNAMVKLPQKVAGGASNLPPLEVRSAKMHYTTNAAVFTSNVTVNFSREKGSTGTLNCDALTLRLTQSNQVESILAERNVRLTEEVTRGKTNISRKVDSAILNMILNPGTGALRNLLAKTNVYAQEIMRHGTTNKTSEVKAQSLEMEFALATNRVEMLLADKDVWIRQDATETTGQHALYRDANGSEIVEITGKPFAKTEQFLIEHASILYWDVRTNMFGGKGPIIFTPRPKPSQSNAPTKKVTP